MCLRQCGGDVVSSWCSCLQSRSSNHFWRVAQQETKRTALMQRTLWTLVRDNIESDIGRNIMASPFHSLGKCIQSVHTYTEWNDGWRRWWSLAAKYSRYMAQCTVPYIDCSVSRLVMTRVTVRYAGHTGRENSGYRQYKVHTMQGTDNTRYRQYKVHWLQSTYTTKYRQCKVQTIQGTYNMRYRQYKVQTIQSTDNTMCIKSKVQTMQCTANVRNKLLLGMWVWSHGRTPRNPRK